MNFPYNELRSILSDLNSSFDRINCGGCGVVAGQLATHLESIVDDVRVVSLPGWCYDGNVSIDEVRPSVADRTDTNSWKTIGFSHVWVEFKCGKRWWAADSEGVITMKEMHKKHGTPHRGSFTAKEMTDLSSNSGGWNWSFERDQIPCMRRMMTNRINILKSKLDYEYIYI